MPLVNQRPSLWGRVDVLDGLLDGDDKTSSEPWLRLIVFGGSTLELGERLAKKPEPPVSGKDGHGARPDAS